MDERREGGHGRGDAMLSTVCLGWPPMRRREKFASFRRWLGLDLAMFTPSSSIVVQ